MISLRDRPVHRYRALIAGIALIFFLSATPSSAVEEFGLTDETAINRLMKSYSAAWVSGQHWQDLELERQGSAET